MLLRHDWPGNVRELRNALERAAILAGGGVIQADHLVLHGGGGGRPARESPMDLNAMERETIVQVLREMRWNKSKAAVAARLVADAALRSHAEVRPGVCSRRRLGTMRASAHNRGHPSGGAASVAASSGVRPRARPRGRRRTVPAEPSSREPRRDFLAEPAVGVGITERGRGVVGATLGVAAGSAAHPIHSGLGAAGATRRRMPWPDHRPTRQRTGSRPDGHSSVSGDRAGSGADRAAPAHQGDRLAGTGERPRSWTERVYHNLIHFDAVATGGHCAAWEQPQLLVNELRVGFRSLR